MRLFREEFFLMRLREKTKRSIFQAFRFLHLFLSFFYIILQRKILGIAFVLNNNTSHSYVTNLLRITFTQVKFRDYAKMIAETKGNMSSDATTAFFSLTQAEYAAGNFKQKVTEGTLSARVRVGAGIDNVAGVKLPVFTIYETGGVADNQSLGLVGGGKKIVAVREKFTVFLSQLIKLASLQTSFVTLDEAMKVTNRRVNALENVTIPKIQGVLDYIERELDELEREGE